MNNPIVPLRDDEHRTLRKKSNAHFVQAKQQHLIPLAVDEIITASAEFPVALVKNKATGEFVVVALMGIAEGENLYYTDGHYSALYAPRTLRLYPFCLRLGNEPTNKEVCFYDDELVISRGEGERLFSDDGKKTKFLSSTIDELIRHDEQLEQTKGFVQLLVSHDLLSQHSVSVSLSKDKKVNFDGIYTIDLKKLDSLNDTVFLSLKKNGALPIIYALSHSLIQLNRLARIVAKSALSNNERS